MKLLELAAVLALATATMAKRSHGPHTPTTNPDGTKNSTCIYCDTNDPETNIQFTIWADGSDGTCDEHNSDDSHEVEHGECASLDYSLRYFTYKPKDGFWQWDDNNGKDCRCFVFVHTEKDCEGIPYCVGPLVDGLEKCHDLNDFRMGEGWSAVVRCDNDMDTKWLDQCAQSPAYQYKPLNSWEVSTDD